MVFGRRGAARVRRGGRGADERWFVVAPLDGGQLVTVVLRAARTQDITAEGAFTVPPLRPSITPDVTSMRFCVTAWIAHDDEARSYRAWRRSKGAVQ